MNTYNSYRMLTTLTLALSLAGCITAPTPEHTDRPWDPPAEARTPNSVWDDLRQRQPDISKPLTLAELTDLALHNSASTRKAWHDARAAAAQVDKAEGLFMPALTVNAGGNRSGVSASPDSFSSQTLQYGPGLQLNYLVINFGGGRAAAVEQALQTVYTANHTFNRTLQDTLLGVETAYFTVISAQAGVEAAQANVTDAQKALEFAQARNTAGIGTALDVLQAQAAVDQAHYTLAAARGQLQVAHGALALAVGLPADAQITPVNPETALPTSLLATNDLRRTIDDAISQRPDIAALRSDLAAKRAAIQVAHAESWPSLYLNSNVNRDYYDTYSGTPKTGDHDWSYGAGINVKWDIFDGWQTESQIRTAEEQAKSAEAVLEQAELSASADVWTRFQNYETSLQKHTFSLAYYNSAAAARDLAAEAYTAGLKTVLDLLTADAQLANARSQQVAARQEVFIALANLIYSTGQLTVPATTATVK